MKIEINLKIILFIILFFILKQIDVYIIFIVSIMLHEMAHLLVGMLVGLRPKLFSINPLGVSLEFYGYRQRKSWKKIVTYFAGPCMNIALAVLFLFISVEEIFGMKVVYTNIILAIFNLVPIMPLDGGKIVKEILVRQMGNKDATVFMNQLTQTILVIFTILYSVAILKLKNLAIFLLILYLWYLKYIEDQKVKTVVKAYEVFEEKCK